MTRKDSEKDSERPHYYSQFWLDIAAGRRTIGGPKPEDEGELLDDAPEPIALRRPSRNEPEEDLDESDGRIGYLERNNERPAALARPLADVVAPVLEEVTPATPDEFSVADDDEAESPTLDETVEDADIPDMDFAEEEESEEDEDEDEEPFEDEEDEEDEGWVAGRGRKKVTPKRPVKQPPPKRAKREPRRGF